MSAISGMLVFEMVSPHRSIHNGFPNDHDSSAKAAIGKERDQEEDDTQRMDHPQRNDDIRRPGQMEQHRRRCDAS